ncbi:MAG: hypothetical protein K1000chlam2_00134 [Chlamydiae bacterium]|nr:hypothetical protein [Chlamydiota bacterium]
MNTLENMANLSTMSTLISTGYKLGHTALSCAIEIPSSITPIPPTWGEMVLWSGSSGALSVAIDTAFERVTGKYPDPVEKVIHFGCAGLLNATIISTIFRKTPSQEFARGFGPIFTFLCVCYIAMEVHQWYQNTGKPVKS